MQGQRSHARRKGIRGMQVIATLLVIGASYGVLVLWLYVPRPPYRNSFAFGNGPIPLVPEWDRHPTRFTTGQGDMVYVDARRNHLLVWRPPKPTNEVVILPKFNRSGSHYELISISATFSFAPDDQLVVVDSGATSHVPLLKGEALGFLEVARAAARRRLPEELETWLATKLAP